MQEIDDGGDLIFLVDRRADWVVGGHDVNVSLVDPGRTWVSVVGTTELNGDRYSVDPYWDDDTQQRFQGSRDHVCALVVRAQRWDYWTAPNRVAEMIELAKAFAIDRA